MEQTNDGIGPAERSQWSSRSIGSRFQHGIFYLLIRIGGRRLAYFLLYQVVFYYVLFRPSIRKKSQHYLSRRFPKKKPLQRLLDSFRMSLGLGKVLVDRAIVGILGTERMKLDISDKELLKRLVDQGRGFILMMSHVGSWQVALSALRFLDVPVNLLLHREEGDIDRHYFEHAGLSTPFNIIDPHSFLGGALEMLEVLKKGEVLCVMGDRVLGSDKSTIRVKFLGEEAPFPFGAFQLASVARVPVVVLFSYKTGPDSYALEVSSVINLPENLGRSSENYRPYVEQFIGELESFVQDYPYQFFNFYDMWQ